MKQNINKEQTDKGNKMSRKKPREKGKIRLSTMFQKLEVGERVNLKKELSQTSNNPKRMEGRTGIIEGMKGKAYIVRINDFNEEKRYVVKPIHLRRLNKK